VSRGDGLSIFHQSASVEYELTERIHIYNEWFALFRCDSATTARNTTSMADALISSHRTSSWTGRAGFGLNDASDGFFTGCGLTIRR